MRRRLLKFIPLFWFAYKQVTKPIFFEQKREDEQKIVETAQLVDQNNQAMITYKSFRKPKEQELLPFTIMNGDQEYQVILTRFEGKVYAISSVCTYDLETDLSQGICFGNKLYCPKHGCQYDVTNGWVENPPAIDNLPIFGIRENEDHIELYAPRIVPQKVIPQYYFRDFNDLRKVVIYGGGAAAYGCMSGLRENGYTGELTLVTPETDIPYDRLKMTKRIRATKPSDFYFRNPNWYETNGIDLLFGRDIIYFSSKHNNCFAELDDGQRLGYDALVMCTGTLPAHRKIEGIEKQNALYLTNMKEHQLLQQYLKTTKNLTIIGITTQSLEVASTIRQEYPDIQVNLIDPNPQTKFHSQYGEELADLVLNYHVEKGVNVYEQVNIDHFTKEHVVFKDGVKLPSQTVLLFPSTLVPQLEFAETAEYGFEFDPQGRIQVDFNQRTEVKRIFAAGSCTSTFYYSNQAYQPGDSWSACFSQGVTAAYNILALNVPWHQIPFAYTEQFDKVLQQTSLWNEFDQIYIEGDLKKWDFIIYYGVDDFIIGAVGTPSKKNRIAIINEAIRCNHVPYFSEIKNGTYSTDDIERALRVLNKSGCYKNQLHRMRHDFVPEFNIWTLRDNMSKMYTPWVDTELSYAPPPKGVQE